MLVFVFSLSQKSQSSFLFEDASWLWKSDLTRQGGIVKQKLMREGVGEEGLQLVPEERTPKETTSRLK